jgi:hypothetical protein
LYTSHILGNPLTVNQMGNDPNSANWRSRTFTYDSVSHLLTANNPESGNNTYTNDANGNLNTKTDARNITVTYGYWGTGIIESDGSGNFQREFIFSGGKRIARRDISTGNVYYYFTDTLGSAWGRRTC